jgi:hypothetical protein
MADAVWYELNAALPLFSVVRHRLPAASRLWIEAMPLARVSRHNLQQELLRLSRTALESARVTNLAGNSANEN